MREKFLKELKERYRDYLYGKCSFSAVYEVEERLCSISVQEIKDNEEIESKIKEVTTQIREAEAEVQKEYDNDVVNPLAKELLEFLKFRGLVKGPEYYKRALKLKEKLEKNDKNGRQALWSRIRSFVINLQWFPECSVAYRRNGSSSELSRT